MLVVLSEDVSSTSDKASLGHDWHNATSTANKGIRTNATCTAATTYYDYCSRCTALDTNRYHAVGSALGHNFKDSNGNRYYTNRVSYGDNGGDLGKTSTSQATIKNEYINFVNQKVQSWIGINSSFDLKTGGAVKDVSGIGGEDSTIKVDGTSYKVHHKNNNNNYAVFVLAESRAWEYVKDHKTYHIYQKCVAVRNAKKSNNKWVWDGNTMWYGYHVRMDNTTCTRCGRADVF